MTEDQRARALDYIADHLPRRPLPGPVAEALTRTRETQPITKTKTKRRDRAVRAEKLPDGRIVLVRDRSASPQLRRLRVVVTALAVALSATLLFFLLAWSPAFRPTALQTLSPTPAADGARAVVVSGAGGSQLIATGLPALAPGYRYVAWNVEAQEVSRSGELVSSGPGLYVLETRTAQSPPTQVTIERGRPTQPQGPVVLEGLTLE